VNMDWRTWWRIFGKRETFLYHLRDGDVETDDSSTKDHIQGCWVVLRQLTWVALCSALGARSSSLASLSRGAVWSLPEASSGAFAVRIGPERDPLVCDG
jgi:hypothetical protein